MQHLQKSDFHRVAQTVLFMFLWSLVIAASAGRRWPIRCLLIGVVAVASAATVFPVGERGESGVAQTLMLASLLTCAAWPWHRQSRERRPAPVLVAAAAATAVAAAFVGFHLPVDAAARPRSAVVLAGSFAHEQPSVDAPTVPKRADMGSFFHWLDGAVEHVEHVEKIEPRTLQGRDLLVMVNLCRSSKSTR